eukprot:snap_masked-scaffold_11-processed-gene-4.36-mRNA-1 protein AED:1.00 eAED:1.00 QI:0/-1/0/0/-1/1/1/0/158
MNTIETKQTEEVGFNTVAFECSQLDFNEGLLQRQCSYFGLAELLKDDVEKKVSYIQIERESDLIKANSWTHKEQVMLVGNVYFCMFVTPNLTRDLWKTIFHSFKKDCKIFGVRTGLGRTQSAIERHFKDLKAKNKGLRGELFRSFYDEWRSYKESYKR